MLNTVVTILKVIAAIPKIKDLISGVIASYLSWLDERECKRIDNAKEKLKNAKTPEDRRAALRDWINTK